MSNMIAEFGGLFCEWSTIVDAPVSYLMTEEELTEYIKEKYGTEGLRQLPERMERVKANGTSSLHGETKKDLLSCNRAGARERRVRTEKEMVKRFGPAAESEDP